MNIHIRDVLKLDSKEDVWDKFHGEHKAIHKVTFDTGETIQMSGAQICISRLYLKLHEMYPGAKIKPTHVINSQFITSTHGSLLSNMFWDIVDELNITGTDFWEATRAVMIITNDVFNASILKLPEFVTSLSIYDIDEVYYHPDVVKSREQYLKREITSTECHDVLRELLFGPNNELEGNEIKRMAKAGIIREGSVYQLIGPRGGVFDIDNKLFATKIDQGYYEGLTSDYAKATESRSASIAVGNTEEPLQDSEVFNKISQSNCSVTSDIVDGSCDNFGTIAYVVEPDDFTWWNGVNHMVDGEVHQVTEDNYESLIGKTLHRRTVLKCGIKNTAHVCKTCVGDIEKVIPPSSDGRRMNFGFAVVQVIDEIMSQLLMSTKHYIKDGEGMVFNIDPKLERWVELTKDQNGLRFNRRRKLPKGHKYVIAFSKDDAKSLNRINTTSVDGLSVSKLTNIKKIAFGVMDSEGEISLWDEHDVCIGGSGSHLSYEVLKYMKTNGYNEQGELFTVVLDQDWALEDPVVFIPERGDTTTLFMKAVSGFVESDITRYDNVDRAVADFIDIIKRKIDCNFVSVDIFIRTCMVVSEERRDFRIPHYGQTFDFMGFKTLLSCRTMSGMLTFDNQKKHITGDDFYKSSGHMDHMLDPILDHGA